MGDDSKRNANALKYGVMVEGILTSRGESCVYRERCPYAGHCVLGLPCPSETNVCRHVVSSVLSHYGYAESWLGAEGLRSTARAIAVISLQSARLAARIADEGFTKLGGRSGCNSCVGIACKRYATAIARKRVKAYRRLLDVEADSNLFSW